MQALKKEYAEDDHYHSVKINKFTRMVHVALEPLDAKLLCSQKLFQVRMETDLSGEKYKIHAIHAEYASMGQYLWIRRLFPDLKFNITEHDMTAQPMNGKWETVMGLKKAYLGFQLGRGVGKRRKIL